MQKKDGQPFAVVGPVEHGGKFFVVHPIAGKGHLDGLSLGVLAQMSFPALLYKARITSGAPSACKGVPPGI